MAFNPAAAAAAFNAQLLAASQPSTPVKTEPSSTMVCSVPVAATSVNNNAGDMGSGSDAIRFLNASGPLLTPGGIAGFSHPMEHEAAFRAAMAQGALPFPAIYPGLHPAEMKPDMMGAVRAVPGFFFDPMPYHPYASGLDGARRKNATRETTAPLKSWLNEHRKNPYPTKAEKIMLALLTKMTLTQVSTWFANARRRLKKENKMTWSPRNRPGEEDDDDLADIDASSERNHSDRPSSSASDGDITVAISDSNQQDDIHSKSATPPPRSGTIDSTPLTLSAAAVPQRKSKIWSIAETLSSRATEANSICCNSKDDRDRASTSAGDGKSSDDGRDSMPPSLDSSGIGPSLLAPGPPPLLPPLGAPMIPTANGQIPQNFLHFNPWQQQQLAMAMATRMPFPRPDLLAMMAQAGQLRPPILFSPMFMGAGIPGVPPPQPPSLPSLANTVPNSTISSSANTSQSNGPTSQWRTSKSTASPVTPSVTSATKTSNGTAVNSIASCDRSGNSNENIEKS